MGTGMRAFGHERGCFLGGTVSTRTQVILGERLLQLTMADADAVDVNPVELDLAAAKKVEEYVEACFQMQNMDNNSAIKVAPGNGENTFLVQFNVHEGTSAAIDKPNTVYPRMVRVYMDVIPDGVYEAERASLINNLCTDSDFISVEGGVIVATDTLDLSIHPCENGLNIHYNSRVFPKAVYNATVGGSRKVAVPELPGAIQLPYQLARAERFVRLCFLGAGQYGHIIQMGMGEYRGNNLFVDFFLLNPPLPIEAPRAYRVFLQTTAAELDQIPPDLRPARESNEMFHMERRGDVLETGMMDLRLHVCPFGVTIRFNESNCVTGTKMYRVGPSRARLNPH